MKVTEQQINIMEAIFELCDAMDDGTSARDIVDVMRIAVKDGHEIMGIKLAMASVAASILCKERTL